jgi:hypothetical protein
MAMALKVTKVDLWSAEIADEPGALAGKLEALAAAGVDLSFLFARRQPDKPGTGVVYLAGIQGPAQVKAAKSVGLAKTGTPAALHVEGTNKPGAVHQIATKLAGAGLNLRGVAASVIGSRFVTQLAFDSAEEAKNAAKLLSSK